MGCWDLNPWDEGFSHARLPKVNGFLVTLFLLQQKILGISAVGDTTDDISETPHHTSGSKASLVQSGGAQGARDEGKEKAKHKAVVQSSGNCGYLKYFNFLIV